VSPSTRVVVLAGVFYAVIGVTFAWPANHVRPWRLAAWLLSAAAYATHIGYEHVRTRSAPGRAALRVASAVALGAFGLALSATFHSLLVAPSDRHRRLVLLALAIWPVMTALPAFVVAFAASELLTRLRWKTRTEQSGSTF
jgi:uncharacterized membrane protein